MTKYIPLEDMDFIWNLKQVQKVIECYNDKMHISHIAKYVRRPQDECAVLIMDLGRKGMI
jgi:hypothetical protein